jgi:hypothetical protein
MESTLLLDLRIIRYGFGMQFLAIPSGVHFKGIQTLYGQQLLAQMASALFLDLKIKA